MKTKIFLTTLAFAAFSVAGFAAEGNKSECCKAKTECSKSKDAGKTSAEKKAPAEKK